MKILLNCFTVGIGGAVGSISRYLFSLSPVKTQSGFPFTTLFINILGSFLIGVILAVSFKNPRLDPTLVLFLKVGFCGGFTTFSAFSLETMGLWQGGSHFSAILYIVLSVILCLSAVAFAKTLIK